MRISGNAVKALAVGLVLALIPISVNAAQKVNAGATCKVLNQKVPYLNKTYTCIKSGKKLVWNKGVSIPQATPIPTPTLTPITKPTPTPTPSAIPTPSPSATTPTPPSTFDDLVSHASGIAYSAWKKSKDQISASQSVLGKPTILIGPNTTLNYPSPLTAFNLASTLYSSSKQVKNIYAIYYSFKDINWAQKTFDSLQDNPGNGNSSAAIHNCQTSATCWGASTSVNAAGDGLMLIAVGLIDPNHTSGSLEAHEYTHTIQMIQVPQGYGTLPRWLLEGQAEWSQAAATYSSNYNDYLKERRNNTNELFTNSSLYTATWIATFLNPNPVSDWAYWSTYENWRLYDIGSLATEALVALKSPAAVMNLYTNVGQGQTFTQAFNTEFGISWADAVPILASAIAAELKQGNK